LLWSQIFRVRIKIIVDDHHPLLFFYDIFFTIFRLKIFHTEFGRELSRVREMDERRNMGYFLEEMIIVRHTRKGR
jgi:hypothetical protein